MTVSRGLKVLILGGVVALSIAFLRTTPKSPIAAADKGMSPALLQAASGSSGDQPIAFPHKVHIENQLECLSCHEFADKSRDAGIPGVESCMSCHVAIKTDSPEVMKLAAFAERREEVPWRRVYKFEDDAHVYFSHKRHVRAGVACASCHGEVEQMQTAQPVVPQSMGRCLECHRTNEAKFVPQSRARDCMTCHN